MNKKTVINILILLILIAVIPLVIKLVQNQQIFRSRASQGTPGVVIFSGPNVSTQGNRTVLKLQENEEGSAEAKVNLIITSPLGPGSGQAATGSATQSGGLR